MTKQSERLIDRFYVLHLKYRARYGAKRTELERIERTVGQIEMFFLAQAIGAIETPAEQTRLNSARRRVMDEVTEGPTGSPGIVAPLKTGQVYDWTMFQITPEFTMNSLVAGKLVSKRAIKELVHAHRAQVIAVTQAIEKRIGRRL